MSDRYPITPFKDAGSDYHKAVFDGGSYNQNQYEIEEYVLDNTFEYESNAQESFRNALGLENGLNAGFQIQIAKTAEDAKNGNWVDINANWWGDHEGLRYETREDGAILIYEGDTPLGWTYPYENENGELESNPYGITITGEVHETEDGKKYYRQENGLYATINGEILKNEDGEYYDPNNEIEMPTTMTGPNGETLALYTGTVSDRFDVPIYIDSEFDREDGTNKFYTPKPNGEGFYRLYDTTREDGVIVYIDESNPDNPTYYTTDGNGGFEEFTINTGTQSNQDAQDISTENPGPRGSDGTQYYVQPDGTLKSEDGRTYGY